MKHKEKNKMNVTRKVRGMNWNDYYEGEKNFLQYGLTEYDVMKIVDDLPITIDQQRKQ
jgi:hypothetical protein